MLLFLRKTIPFPKHVINTISPSTSQQFLCLQTQCLLSSITNLSYFSTSIPSNDHSFTVSYLIHTCGFSPQDAASATKYVTFETPQKPDLVINFLKTHGFSKPQMLRFIKEAPQILRFDPHKTLLPKIEFFKSKGISDSHIPKLLSNCPTIMRTSLHKKLIPSFDFLRGLFESDDKFIKTLTLFPGVLIHHDTCVLPNMKLLREVGVPESNIIALLQHFPRSLTTTTSRFKMIVRELQEMGFHPLKSQFVMAVTVLSSLSKCTWSRKANLYKKWGWSDEDVVDAFRKYPFCMKGSEDKIEAILDYLVHQLGCESSNFIKYPYVLGFSLNERIVPRGAVIQVLLSKGLVKKEKLLAAFMLHEKDFLRRFVHCHEVEASQLLELYQSNSKLDLAREVGSG